MNASTTQAAGSARSNFHPSVRLAWQSAKRKTPLLIIYALAAAALFIAVNASDSANFGWVMESFRLTIVTILETLAGLILFLIIFSVSVLICGRLYGRRATKNHFAAASAASMILLIIVNSFPIVFYMGLFKDIFGGAQWLFRISSLLMANAMLYYFFYLFMSEIIAESKKLYVISAAFKGPGHDAANYLREAGQWFILALLRPLFYYLFSFTLFTEAFSEMLFSDPFYGIVQTLFTMVLEEGFRIKFLVYFLTMLVIVLPVRFLLCDLPLLTWQQQRNLNQA